VDDLLSIAVSNAVAATILALLAIAVSAVYRRPALVHGLWLLVLLKLVTPPLVFIPVAWPTTAEAPPLDVVPVQEEPTNLLPPAAEEKAAPVAEPLDGGESLPPAEKPSSQSPVVPQEPPMWPQLLRIVWGIGALIWFLLALERLHHFRRLLRFARPAPAALQERTRRLAHGLGLKRCPRVRLLPGRIAPMLWAIGGPPRLLVPADLLEVLSEEQLDTLLMHELAHLRRRDHWVRVLEIIVMGLYWWHPVVWYARRELREAEEQCCDAWVVSMLPDTGRTYASALLDTLDFLSTSQTAVPPLASGLSHITDLKRRLTMIMQGNTPRSLTWPGCLAVVTLGLTFLPMLPSLHGEPPRKEELVRDQIDEAEEALEKAKAALDRQKAELDRKVKELHKAKEFARTEQRLDGEEERLQDKREAYHIVIAVPRVEDVNPKEIVQEIKKVLREKLRDKAVHYHIQIGGIPPIIAAKPPLPPPALQRGRPHVNLDPNVRSQPWSEKRINELEKKLEKVLDELHELRKRIKDSPPGVEYSPNVK
jgi:bla regulator protein BlaR1